MPGLYVPSKNSADLLGFQSSANIGAKSSYSNADSGHQFQSEYESAKKPPQSNQGGSDHEKPPEAPSAKADSNSKQSRLDNSSSTNTHRNSSQKPEPKAEPKAEQVSSGEEKTEIDSDNGVEPLSDTLAFSDALVENTDLIVQSDTNVIDDAQLEQAIVDDTENQVVRVFSELQVETELNSSHGDLAGGPPKSLSDQDLQVALEAENTAEEVLKDQSQVETDQTLMNSEVMATEEGAAEEKLNVDGQEIPVLSVLKSTDISEKSVQNKTSGSDQDKPVTALTDKAGGVPKVVSDDLQRTSEQDSTALAELDGEMPLSRNGEIAANSRDPNNATSTGVIGEVGKPSASAQTQQVATPVELSIAKAVTDPSWGDKLIEKVRWVVNASQQRAEIRLDPPDLGPMKLEVSLKQEHAQVTLVTHSSQVKEILDQHLPRLREMLESQGFDSVDAQTQERSGEGQKQANESGSDGRPGAQSDVEGDDHMHQSMLIAEKPSKGRVDCYI